MGAIARQGPHHVAQKSTSTGLSDFNTSASKFASVTSTIPLPAIVISPRCNVALSADSPCSQQRAVVAGPGDLNLQISASPSGHLYYRTTLNVRGFDAEGVQKVASDLVI